MFTFNTRPKTTHANPKQERIWPKVAEYQKHTITIKIAKKPSKN